MIQHQLRGCTSWSATSAWTTVPVPLLQCLSTECYKAEKGHFLGGPRWYLQLIPYVSWSIRLCHPSGNTSRPHQFWQTLLLHQQNESKSHVLDRCVLKKKPEMCLTKALLTLLSTCKQKYPNKFRVDRGKPHLSLHVLEAFCIQETF